MPTDRDLLLITGQIVAGYLDLVRRHSDGQIIDVGPPEEPVPHLLTRAGTRALARNTKKAKRQGKKGAARGRIRPSGQIKVTKTGRRHHYHTCLICQEKSGQLSAHLRHVHNMTPLEYITQHGGAAMGQFPKLKVAA